MCTLLLLLLSFALSYISTATKVTHYVIACKAIGNVKLMRSDYDRHTPSGVIKIKMISSTSAAHIAQLSEDKLKYQFLSFSILRHYLSYSL